MVLRGRRFVTFSRVCKKCRKSCFCGRCGAILLRRFQKLSCIFRGRRSTLETSIVILRGRRSTSDVATLYTLHFYFTLHTFHSTLYTPHSTLFTPHSTLQTPHFTLHTLHSTLYISTLYTLHFTLYTPHSTLHTLHFTLHTPHFALHPLPHSTVHWYGNGETCTRLSKKNVSQKSVLRDCIRVRGLHIVFCWLNPHCWWFKNILCWSKFNFCCLSPHSLLRIPRAPRNP